MEPGFDDNYQELIYRQAHAAMRTSSSLGEMCQILGGFRANLIACGFSVDGAEGLAHELFLSISAAALAAGSGDDE